MDPKAAGLSLERVSQRGGRAGAGKKQSREEELILHLNTLELPPSKTYKLVFTLWWPKEQN